MVNINFFEKKKINITPFVLMVIALLLFSFIAFYFWWMTTSILSKTENNQALIASQELQIKEWQRVNLISDQVTTLVEQRDQLSTTQFPVTALYNDLLAQLPNETDALIERFFFTITGNLQLECVFNNDQDVVLMHRQLVNLPYVTDVTLETVEISDTDYVTRFTLMIDRNQVSEVLTDDF